MTSALRTTARPFEDFRVRHESELAALYKRTRAASWKITEEQWAAAIYSAAISGASETSAVEQELAIRAYMSCLHAQDLAFVLAVRSGCSDAIEYLATQYMPMLRNLAERITNDDGRVIALTKKVFDELCGHRNEHGPTKSQFEDFDGRVSLVTWFREVMLQRETDRPQATAALRHQLSTIDCYEKADFLEFLELLDAIGAAPLIPPPRPIGSRLWLTSLAVVVVGLICVVSATTRQSQRFAALHLSAIADHHGDSGSLRPTSRDASLQLEQSTFTYSSSGFVPGSDSSGLQSRQAKQFAGDIAILFSGAEADARFAMTTVSHPPVLTKGRKIGSDTFAEDSAIVRPDPVGRVSEPPPPAIAETWTNGSERSAVPATPSYVEAKIDATRPGNSVFGADSAKTDESKPGSSDETVAAAVARSDAGASKPIMIASTGHLTTWVLTSGGVINRSNDGVSWQPLNSGTDRDLTAGTAPSAEVCWVVGRAGTILRTTDGEQWERIPSPAGTDLMSIAAADEYSAIVLTSDGRRFATNNGGETWQLTRN
jgi:hypothetical protein